MKRLLISMALVAAPLIAQAQVGISINVGEPGFYGQIELGNSPPPPVVYSAPVMVEQGPGSYPPIYLRVPEEHHRNWHHYCHQYNACNRQVYFVTEDWYANHYSREHGHGHEHDREYDEHRHDEGHHHDDEYHRDHDHEHEHDRDDGRY